MPNPSELARLDAERDEAIAKDRASAATYAAGIDGYMAKRDEPTGLTYAQLVDLLNDSLTAWEGEEDSVKEEHEDLIDALREGLANVDEAMMIEQKR